MFLDITSRLRKNDVNKVDKKYKPKTLVMIPCKGSDLTLYENISSAKKQSYTDYDVVAIVDSESDEALKYIKKAQIKYTISDKTLGGSGKVKAIATALIKFKDYDAYVILDSDVYLQSEWLFELIKPLSDKKVGISTMYPFFKPTNNRFWSYMKMVWGFVGDSLLENEKRRFAWGGSLAFRKDLINKDSLKFFTNSKYSVSDDISLTKIAKSKNLKIAYVKEPKPVVNCNETFGTFFEWANRQTALTVLGYRKNLYQGLIYYTSEVLLFIFGVLFSLFISPVFLIYFIHLLKSIIITLKRSKSKNPIIIIAVIFAPFVYEINLIIASKMKSIQWRGKVYKLESDKI